MNAKKRTLVFATCSLLLLALSTVSALAYKPPGTGTPGFWKNHPGAWPLEEGETLWLGSGTYTKDVAIAIMMAPVKGDKCYTMFDALVAAKLNAISGNPHDCIKETGGAAIVWMWENKCLDRGQSVEARSDAWQDSGEALYEILDAYNKGELCAPSRDDLE